MMNEVLEVLADVPPMLAAAWAAWLGAGLLLTVWYRRAKLAIEEQQTTARAMPRAKSSGARPAARPRVAAPARSHAAAPAVKSDPFADLAQIFDESTPGASTQHPGDTPTLKD